MAAGSPTGISSLLPRRSLVLLVALLLGSTTLNYIDRQVLSVLAPVLRDEFHLSNAQYAGILNAFMITYALGMPAAGWVLDRIGVGRGLTLAVTWWSFAGMLTALAQGPLSLGACRSLLAIGESGAWPSFAKAVSLWVPAQWRTLAIGVCNSGSSLGAMIAPPLVVFLVSDLSNFTTGLAALRLERHGWSPNRTRKFLMALGAVFSPIGVAAAFTTSLFWTMTFISTAIFFWMIWSVTVQTLPGDYFPPRAVASAYGFGGLGSTLGSVISIWLVGRTLDITGSYTPVFLALGLVMPVAFTAGMLLMGRVERLEFDA